MSTEAPVSRRQFSTGLLLAMLGSVLFSAKAIVVKLHFRLHVDAETVLALRMLFSLPFFAAIAMVQRRRCAPLHASDRWRIVFLGVVGYYLSSYLDFLGLQYISAGLERLLLFLTPSFVLLMSVFWLNKRVSRREWLALVISYSGTVLVFVHDVGSGRPDVWLGATFVLCGAVTYAMYLLLSGELVRRVGSQRLVSYVMCVSTAVSLGQFLLLHPPQALLQTADVYQLSMVNAVLCTVLPVFFTMMSIARVGAPVVSLAGMIGPVSTLFLAAAILGEPITPIQLAGTGLVMAGIWQLSRKTS